MAIIGSKPILEIPSHLGFHGNSEKSISLEEAIREDFGEEGLTKFKSYNVELKAPINMGFELGFTRYCRLQSNPNEFVGLTYQLSSKNVNGMSAENVNVHLDRYSDKSSIFTIKLDLNSQNPECQYLKLFLDYDVNNQ